eukprot:6020634-Prymnesium_polylepis.1
MRLKAEHGQRGQQHGRGGAWGGEGGGGRRRETAFAAEGGLRRPRAVNTLPETDAVKKQPNLARASMEWRRLAFHALTSTRPFRRIAIHQFEPAHARCARDRRQRAAAAAAASHSCSDAADGAGSGKPWAMPTRPAP